MNSKTWSVFLGLFQIENMDCLPFLLFPSTLSRNLKKTKEKIMLQIESD